MTLRLANASTIQAVTANRSASPGAAYESEKELFVGQECVAGTIVEQGTAHSTFTFATALSEKQASSLLGLEANGRARFGAVEASASARFLKNSVSSDFSVSAVWASDYVLPDKKLTVPVLTTLGASVKDDPGRWSVTCGNEYVDQISYGARLLFSVRIDFASKEQKQEFEAKFSVSGPLASLDSTLKEATREFSRDTKINISATQFGGDVSKLTAIFAGAPDGRSDFVQCSLGDFERCAQVVNAALVYASDVNTGFPSQLAPGKLPGPGVLEYRTSPYTSAGIFMNNPILDELNRKAREELHAKFEEQFRWKILSDRLLEISLGEEQRANLTTQVTVIDENLDDIVGVSKVCYEHPFDCRTAVNGLTLTVIDVSAFNLPPSAAASFRVWTSERGLLSREESVRAMTACRAPGGGVCRRPAQLADAAGAGTASTVLYIRGVALREAVLFFEGRKLGAARSLQPTGDPSEKIGPDWAMLVVETTRGTAGWRDISLDLEREALWGGDLPVADGVFYVIVSDAFGRKSRFDIEYENWNRNVPGSPLRRANRWWDAASNGTSTAGVGGWTYETLVGSTTWTRHDDIHSIAICACGGGGGGGGAGGARNEVFDNGGGGGGGAGSPAQWKILTDLKARQYVIEIGMGGAGGAGGPGGGGSGDGTAGRAGTATRFGPSVDLDPATGNPADPRVWTWEGAPPGAGGIGARGSGIFPGLGIDGRGGAGASGTGFVSGGNGGNPESGGGSGAAWAHPDDPMLRAAGGAGGGVQAKDGVDGGGGGGGGGGFATGGVGGNGGGFVATPGGDGGLCGGGGGGGAYGEANASGTSGGRGGSGALVITKVE